MEAKRLGEVLQEVKLISGLQLKEALQVQKEDRRRIGAILVELGYVSPLQLRDVVQNHRHRIPLGEYLLEKGVIDREQLESTLMRNALTHQKLGEALIDSGLITEEQLAEALGEQLDMLYIVPYARMVDRRVFTKLPANFMRHHVILPLTENEGVTTVLVTGPVDEAVSMQLEHVFNQQVKFALSTASKITETLDVLLGQGALSDVEESAPETEAGATGKVERASEVVEFASTGSEERNAVELLSYFVEEAVKDSASDIHLESIPDRLRVWFRVNGSILHKTDLPRGAHGPLFRRIKVLCGLDISELHQVQEGRFTGRLEGKKVDFRVSVFPGVQGESIDLRLFHQGIDLRELEDLDMTPNVYGQVCQSLSNPSGLMIFCGPPSSGKTTTMYTVLNHLKKQGVWIVTVEDPVEAIIAGTLQGQLSKAGDAPFSEIMASLVHQDPDVIAVGEVRSDEHARELLSVALMGHKILTTIQADDTMGALLRLIDAGLERYLRSATALTIVCQRLVRKICPNCRSPFTPTPDMLLHLPLRDFDPDKYDFFHGKGCSDCQNTGYSGSSGIFEVLVMTSELRQAFLQGATSTELRQMARSSSPFLTVAEVGLLKAIRGTTTLQEVLRVAPSSVYGCDIKQALTLPDIERISEQSDLSS